MQEQINKFKKRTQQFGDKTISAEINAQTGTMFAAKAEIDGNLAGIDVQPCLRTTQLVKCFGQQYDDGLYEFYDVQDMRENEWVENSGDVIYFYKHDLAVNQFTSLISSDSAIMSKYAVRLKSLNSFGRYPYNDGNLVSFTSNLIVTDGIVGGTYAFGTFNGYSDHMSEAGINNTISPWGQASLSDILADVQYVQKSGTDERALQFDIIYELEFKRIIE